MIIEKIRRIPLLSEMDTAVLDRCIAKNQIFVRHYSKGATVHHQHEACSVLDVVLSGKLVAYSLSENGSAITMFEFQKNSIIGANLLFGENTNYPLNIYGVTDGDVLHITREAVMEFLHDYHFVMRFIKSLSLNSQGMNRGCGQKPGPKKRGKCPCIPMTKECEQYSFILSLAAAK